MHEITESYEGRIITKQYRLKAVLLFLIPKKAIVVSQN